MFQNVKYMYRESVETRLSHQLLLLRRGWPVLNSCADFQRQHVKSQVHAIFNQCRGTLLHFVFVLFYKYILGIVFPSVSKRLLYLTTAQYPIVWISHNSPFDDYWSCCQYLVITNCAALNNYIISSCFWCIQSCCSAWMTQSMTCMLVICSIKCPL